MKFSGAMIVAACASLLSVGSHAAPQTPIRSERVGVRFDVLVTAHGAPLTGLSPSAFTVVDNGVTQAIDTAAQADHLTAIVVLDLSVSVRLRKRGFTEISAGINAACDALRSADQVALVTVTDQITLPVALASTATNCAAIRRAIDDRLPTSALPLTRLWDAVRVGASLGARNAGRTVVLCITDGFDNASWLARSVAADVTVRVGTIVDLILLARPKRDEWVLFDSPPPGSQMPQALASDTGGVTISVDDGGLPKKLRAHLDLLRQSYVLTYTPNNAGAATGWHDVTISVPSRTDATIKTRKGYFAQAGRK